MILNLGNSFGTPSSYIVKSPTSQLKSFINENIGVNDLIVFDSRIYTARSFWLGTPYYISDVIKAATIFSTNSQIQDELKSATDVYFIECIKEDCGWGNIKEQPELNKSMKDFFAQLQKDTIRSKTIKEKIFYGNEFFGKKESQPIYAIYYKKIYLNPTLLAQTYRMNYFYFTPYLYKDMSNYIYKYEIKSLSDRLLNSFSFFVILLSVLLSICSVFFVIYLLLKQR
ncbi:MAG: hypothetical protein QW727_03555 [Candidatus Pacearchaeota archaeon]